MDIEGNLSVGTIGIMNSEPESPSALAKLAQLEGDVEPEINIEEYDENDDDTSFSWRKLWAFTGPGFLMSIAYVDPGNLESDLQAGAYTGYQLIWVLLFSTALGLVLQIMSARLGVVTGKDLAQICKIHYTRPVSLLLWIMTELAIIGSDIQEVIGSSIALNLLFGLPLYAGVLITGADTITFLALHYFGIRKLEAVFASLITTMCVCFFVDFGYIGPSGSGVLKGFLPTMESYAVIQAVGIVGAVIMPHNLYLHSALVKSRAVDRARTSKVREANFYFAIEASVALLVSFFINLAVVAVFAAGFFDEDCAQDGQALIDGVCKEVSLADAGTALQNALGSSARYVWGVGLLAAGQSSTMTGTYAGQFVMEGFVAIRVKQWQRVAITRSLALVPALLVALISNGTSADDKMGEWLNVLQSIQLPFALLPLLHFTSSREIMGEFVNPPLLIVFTWTVGVALIGMNFYLIINQFFYSDFTPPDTWWFYMLLVLAFMIYIFFILYIIRDDLWIVKEKLKRFWARVTRREGALDGPLLIHSQHQQEFEY